MLCRKHNRGCIYEKQSRPPLTRRYVEKLENELAQMKATIQQIIPENAMADNHINFATSVQASTEARPSMNICHPPVHSEQPVRAGRPGVRLRPHLYDSGMDSHVEQQSPTQFGVSFESSPSSGNWEWDERTSRTCGDKFVDGMASLTSNSHEGGYLGVASGAALLRITDPGSHGSRGKVDADTDRGAESSNRSVPSIPFALDSLGQLEPFVDGYFAVFHRSYPIVHEATFRAQFMEVIPRPKANAWQVLLFVVAAVGAFAASTDSTTDIDLSLFEAAKARLSIDVLETGNTILVQALTLISNYMQKRNKPNSGYNYMGLARRTAMAIGLHKEVQRSRDISLFMHEMRRRIWYCLYIFDVGAIITFSRPLDFPQNGVDVELPMNVHDTDITQETIHQPRPANETTAYTHLRAQATFHMATNEIYSNMISNSFPSAAELIDADDRFISRWLSTLPLYFKEDAVQGKRFRLCHAILRWRYRNFRTLMYRPILLRRVMARPERHAPSNSDSGADEDIAIQRCLEAARESVELISDYWEKEDHNTMACWYGLYFLFQAVLIPIYCLRNDPQSSMAVAWRSQISKAMRTIESMSRLNETASRCLDKIRSVCEPYLDHSVDGWGLPTEESPQTQIANLYSLMWPTLEIAQMDGLDASL
ncbi:Zn(II)2Cys6 transcription factor [Penicillium argentinense]|uniref:Zn(II)2Cys6 transcription factor n=1 Tax=Penicillium argentinense TaxID=1131581 RepID=A0A9W9EJS4_9EURO|nr:Zn(II)2Cys6 transcription factor [Penicillium argentinense]KAJ5083035.1 Zn(II)2Cys6 transcription factor [Penicillium argentinense]